MGAAEDCSAGTQGTDSEAWVGEEAKDTICLLDSPPGNMEEKDL